MGFLSVDFGNTRTHLVAGIEWMRSLGNSIENVQEQLQGVRDAVQASGSSATLPEELASGWSAIDREMGRVCNDLAEVRSVVDRIHAHLNGGRIRLDRAGTLLEALRRSEPRAIPPDMETSSSTGAADSLPAVRNYRASLSNFRGRFRPLPFLNSGRVPTPEAPLPGTGVYIRTDYWAQLVSGGSYSHTCYVAKELARVTEKLHLSYGRVVIPCSTRWGSLKK